MVIPDDPYVRASIALTNS